MEDTSMLNIPPSPILLRLLIDSLLSAVWYNAPWLVVLSIAMTAFYALWANRTLYTLQQSTTIDSSPVVDRIIVVYAGVMTALLFWILFFHTVGSSYDRTVSYAVNTVVVVTICTYIAVRWLTHSGDMPSRLHVTSLTLSGLGLLNVWVALEQFKMIGTLTISMGLYVLFVWMFVILTAIRLYQGSVYSGETLQKRTISLFTVTTLLFVSGFSFQNIVHVHSSARHGSVDISEMALIPAGTFWYGCAGNQDAECASEERPGRWTYLDSFYIDRYEATVADYRACVTAGGCSSVGLRYPIWFHGEIHPEFAWACNWGKRGYEDHPINCIRWEQAAHYCQWKGERLPTDLEWEKAARGATDKRIYPWGNEGYTTTVYANIADESAGARMPHWLYQRNYNDGAIATAPVGSYREGISPYGIYDMIGNVEEWTSSWYDKEKGQHSLKGSSWHRSAEKARISFTYKSDMQSQPDYGGVRCASSPLH